jgi:hypothetical protein
MEEIILNQTYDELKATYRSIDIRVILGKSKIKPNGKWTCVFLKIRLTREHPLDLKNSQKELGDIDRESFKALLDCREVKDFENLINELQNGSLTLKGINAVLQGSDYKNILNNIVAETKMYTTTTQREGFVHFGMFTSMTKSIVGVLESDLGLTENDYGGRLERIKKQLEIDIVQDGNNNNSVILFPVYCKRNRLFLSDRGKAAARFEMHRVLVNSCIATMTNPFTDEYAELECRKYMADQAEEMPSILLPCDFNLKPGGHIEVEIRHNLLGIISHDTIPNDEILSPPYRVYPLLDSFLLFGARDKLIDYLLSKGHKRQELATQWFLSLLGWRSIYFGGFDEKDQKYSADTIAEYSKNILLVIDSTISFPKDHQIGNIYNTARYVEEKTMKTVIPIILSSEDCTTFKESAWNRGVVIVDKADIFNICSLLLKGNTEQASNLFSSIIKTA